MKLNAPLLRTLSVLSLSFALVSDAQALITVTTNADSGAGSLRQAVLDAAATDTIDFDASLSGQTITLTSGQISINNKENLTIDASALPAGITIDGNASSRIFQFNAGINTLNSLTLINGNGSGGSGGAINVNSGVELTVLRSTLAGNSADFGGAILNNDGIVTVQNSTLTGNSASDAGGGIFTFQGTLTVQNSTLAGNDSSEGGGISNGSTLTLNDSIIAGNTATTGPDLYDNGGTLNTTGVNLLSTLAGSGLSAGTTVLVGSPGLAALGNYGGPTQTMPPLPGTLAVDAGGTTALLTDQRGYTRVVNGTIDIGAVEVQSAVVLNNSDSGVGSLRDNILIASPRATITFDAGLSGDTIILTGSQIIVEKSLTIDASALPDGITLDADGADRHFRFESGTTSALNSLTLVNGVRADNGGSILNRAVLTITGSTLASNSASADGGAIFNEGGIMTVENSTLSGNQALRGGGIYNRARSLTVENSTLSGNSASSEGGGIYNEGAVKLDNSIVAGNTATTLGPDLRHLGGAMNTTAVNLLSDLSNSSLSTGPTVLVGAPNLAPLGDYGGPTQTMPPLPGSPAIDPAGGDASSSLATDQRGYARVVNGIVDIGAVEVQLIIATEPPVLTGLTVLEDGTFQFGFPSLTGASLSVFATTDLSLPVSQWTLVGPATELPANSGQFQFTDTEAANFTKRFYIVTSP